MILLQKTRSRADLQGKAQHTHDSVIVSIVVVKDHGESLLIKLPKAASWFAKLGNTLLPALIRVFPSPLKIQKGFANPLIWFIDDVAPLKKTFSLSLHRFPYLFNSSIKKEKQKPLLRFLILLFLS